MGAKLRVLRYTENLVLPGGQLRKHVFGDSENFVKMSCFSDSNFYKAWRRGRGSKFAFGMILGGLGVLDTVAEGYEAGQESGQRPPEAEAVEITWTDGSSVPVYLSWRSQPHGGRSLLLRWWRCQSPRRALYGAKVGDDGRFYVARRADWECRTCCTLRYSSEGGALLIRGGLVSRLLRQPFPSVSSPRPNVWLPYIFTDIDQAIEVIA